MTSSKTLSAPHCHLIGSNAPLTIQAAKGIIAELLKPAEKIDRAHCEELVARCFTSEDYEEGRARFSGEAQAGFLREVIFAGRMAKGIVPAYPHLQCPLRRPS